MLALILPLSLAACTDPDGARASLEAAGYQAIEVLGRPHRRSSSCGDGEAFATHVRALAPTGRVVEAVVCAETGKPNSIRVTRAVRRDRPYTFPWMEARP